MGFENRKSYAVGRREEKRKGKNTGGNDWNMGHLGVR